MDSALALHWAIEHSASSQVHAWGIDYKQRHARELESAKAIAGAAWVPFKSLTARIPWAPISSDVIPGRNLMLLSIVAAQAATRHGEPCTLVVGANHADLDGFLDCRPGFFAAAAKAIALGLGADVSIVTPFIDRTKADLVRYARAEPARWHALSLSWTCYEGGAKPCGVCGACVKRAAGFAEAGEADPCL